MNYHLSLRAFVLLISVFSFLSLIGCQHPSSLNSNWGIPAYEVDGDALSIPVTLVADNQLHHLYGNPVWLRSGFTNKFVPVAIRPVQLDFYAPDIFRWIIKDYGKKQKVIHLGDALNIACSVEFDRFNEIMSESGRGWVMAPGNHDFYYFGNGHFAWSEWQKACTTGDGKGIPMTKDLFVKAYLQALAKQSGKHKDFGFTSSEPIKSQAWEAPSAQSSFVSGVWWNIDTDSPWRSFIVQRLNLTLPNPVSDSSGTKTLVTAILLDTNQYEYRPRLIPFLTIKNSGLTGEFLDDQISAVEKVLKDKQQGEITILMGHHPYHTLSGHSKDAIDRWRRDYGIALYVSAHTHTAQYFVQKSKDENWLELNIGSTTDWPPEFRTFLVSTDERFPDKGAFRMARYPVHKEWDRRGIPECLDDWEVTTNRDDFYINYAKLETPNPRKTQIHLMNTLLRSYDWLLQFVKSGDNNKIWPDGTKNDQEVVQKIQDILLDKNALEKKLSFLRRLQNFEAEREVKDSELQKEFHLCQAKWASKYDLKGARKPNVDDNYVLFPRR